jgi:L-ascorbate metabolism protein UlaG (beta-lactamase superfamily)
MDITLTLIGGPTVLIDLNGFHLLTDPTFDPPQSYDLGPVTLVKESGPALPADGLGPIDAVLLSHDQHADNLDAAGRALLPRAGAVFTTTVGASRLGPPVQGLVPWQTAALPGAGGARLLVTGTPARHGPPGIEPITGEVTGFLLGIDEPGDAVYVSGDTVWYDGVAEVARRYRPRLIILFTGSAEPRGRFHLTMDSNDAIESAHAFGDARVVAVHNHGWAHFKESQDELAEAFGALGLGSRLTPLSPGQPVTLTL